MTATLPTAEPVRSPDRTPGAKSYGPAAARLLTRLADGVDVLMPWQQRVLDVALELDDADQWRYRIVVVTVPRQNGKTTIARGVIPHRLAYRPGRLVIGTAQDLKLARRLWLELTGAIETAAPATVGKVFRGFGSEELTLANGSGYLPVAPSPAAGHGLTLDLAYVDEAWRIEDERLSQGMEPALMVRRGQLWVVSTAGHDRSVWLRRLVEQGRAGTNPSLCLIEYAAPADADPADPATWAGANPALGLTLELDELASRFRTMDLAEFERAHLNRWTHSADRALPPAWWAAATDPDAAVAPVVGRVAVALDVSGDRSAGAVGIAGRHGPRVVVELADYRPGTDWLAARAEQLWREWRPAAVYVDPFGPANTVADELDRRRVPIVRVNAGQLTAAAAGLYDDLRDDRIRHRGQPALDLAADGATRRTVLDRWAFSRAGSSVDIAPLNAVSLARFALLDTPTGSTTIRTAAGHE